MINLLGLSIREFHGLFQKSSALDTLRDLERQPPSEDRPAPQKILVQTINEPNPQALGNFSKRRFMPCEIVDPKIRKLAKVTDGVVDLDNKHGLCRGIVEWFIFLVLKTEKVFRNEEQRLILTAKKLCHGATEEAILLHAFKKYHLIKTAHSPFKLYLFSPERHKKKALKYLKKLPDGIFKVVVHVKDSNDQRRGHAIAIIKGSERYIFDSNEGLKKCEDFEEETLKKIVSFINQGGRGQALCTLTLCTNLEDVKKAYFYKKEIRKTKDAFIEKNMCSNITRFKFINMLVGGLRANSYIWLKEALCIIPILLLSLYHWMKEKKDPLNYAKKMFIKEIEVSSDLKNRVNAFFSSRRS